MCVFNCARTCVCVCSAIFRLHTQSLMRPALLVGRVLVGNPHLLSPMKLTSPLATRVQGIMHRPIVTKQSQGHLVLCRSYLFSNLLLLSGFRLYRKNHDRIWEDGDYWGRLHKRGAERAARSVVATTKERKSGVHGLSIVCSSS